MTHAFDSLAFDVGTFDAADATRKLEIYPSGGGAYVDMTTWLDGSSGNSLLVRTQKLNEPQKLSFSLTDGITGLAIPVAGNRVRATTALLSNFFTGYLTNTPQRVLLGADSSGNPVYGYRCQAVDESLRLEWNTAAIFPTLKPFTNKTQGEILKNLISLLSTGFTTTGIQDGILIPYFRVKPDEGFWDVVRRLSDNTNMVFWVSAGACYYTNFREPYQISDVASDNFNRVSLGSNWTLLAGNPLTISANALHMPTAGISYTAYSGYTPGPNQSCEFQYATVGGTPEYTQIGVRVSYATAGLNGYFLYGSSGSVLVLIKYIGGSGTILTSAVGTVVTGDKIKISVSGTTIRGYKNGSLVLTATDSELVSGSWGILAIGDGGSNYQDIDNFIGGDDGNFSYSPNESDSFFEPAALDVSPIQNPTLNDVVGLGDIEPEGYVTEYHIGDGFTGAIPLKFPLYGADSSKLLEDPFTGSSIDSSRWTETDPSNYISASGGSLLFSGASTANNNRLTATQGLEIAGVLELRAGRVKFGGATTALIGGLFSSDTGLIAQCIAGFKATKQGGAGTRLQAVVSGAVAGPTYDIVAGKTYQFFLTVNCVSQARRRRQFYSLLGSVFGGEDVTANAVVTFSVSEFSDNVSDDPTTVLTYTSTISSIQQFLYYTLVSGPANGTDAVNLTLNFTLLRKAIAAQYWTKKSTDSDYVQRRISDAADQEAWAVITTGSQGYELTAMGNHIPDAGELIKILYRQAGQARARVKLSSSITAQASISGDAGTRTALLSKVYPEPRDVIELESALLAFVTDYNTQYYNGSWEFNSQAYTIAVDPVPGRFVLVSAPTRYPIFSSLVTEVVVSVDGVNPSNDTDIITVSATFGKLNRLQGNSPLDTIEDALIGPFDKVIPLVATEFASVGASFSADRPNAKYDGTKTSSTFELDMGAAPTTNYEVRKTDLAWGSSETIDKIVAVNPTTQTFTIPRTTRDVLAYVKNKDGSGLYSRFPSIIRVVYPLTPSAPVATINASNPLNLHLSLTISGNVSDVAQIEVRASDNSTVLKTVDFLVDSDLEIDLGSVSNLAIHVYFKNWLAEYSSGTVPTITLFRSGHVSYRPLTNPLTATDAGASATISISSFTMRSGATDASINSGSITSLSFSTLYYIYYDDASFAGGAVTYHATTTKETALAGDNRYFVGSITTPEDGGVSSVGNDDGGSGAQSGALLKLSASDYVQAYQLGNGAILFPLLALTGVAGFLTGAGYSTILSVNVNGSDNEFAATWSGFPALTDRFSSVRLKFSWIYAWDTGHWGSVVDGDWRAVIQYSIDGGQSFTVVEALTTVATSGSEDIDLTAATLGQVLNLGLVQVNAAIRNSAGDTWSGVNSGVVVGIAAIRLEAKA